MGEETFSTPFGFAMLLIYGVPEVVLVQVIATLAADVVGRRPADRIIFNLAQLTISWAAAGAVLDLLGGSGLGGAEGLQPEDLPAIAASAAVFFAVNSTFTRSGEALLQQTSIVGHLRADLLFRSWSAATLFALGPPVAVIAEEWLYLVPALALPMAAVHRASRQASEMEYLALHDPLTSLPNRALLTQRAAQAIRRPSSGEGAAVLTLDLDRFRDVNDTLGRDHGDALLIEVGSRLAGTVRASDLVARIEGDRFAVLLPAVAGSADAEAAAVKILEALSRPLEVAGANLAVDASVGIACSPEHGDDAQLLLQRAETAMSRAKRAQSRYELYTREMDAEAPRRLVLVSALKRALDEGGMDLHYQPKVELQHGRVVGVEALARWTDIGLGEVPPTTFVPLAERTGLAEQLTELVLEIAGRDAQRWREAGCAVPVAVNIPTRVLLDPGLPGRFEELKRRFGLDASSLEIEITEGTLIADHDQARAVLAQLRAIGVRSSIDDFGTGYSSLAYLRELPVDALKIDRSFITRARRRRGLGGDRALDHRAGPQPRPRDRGRGRRGGERAPTPRAPRLRLCPGLPARAADAGRRDAGVAARDGAAGREPARLSARQSISRAVIRRTASRQSANAKPTSTPTRIRSSISKPKLACRTSSTRWCSGLICAATW